MVTNAELLAQVTDRLNTLLNSPLPVDTKEGLVDKKKSQEIDQLLALQKQLQASSSSKTKILSFDFNG